MNSLKFILSRLNIILFALITLIGAITFTNSILSYSFYKIITEVSPLTIVIGTLVGLISTNFYVKTCVKEETKSIKDYKEHYIDEENEKEKR
jgi:hypothetical protein